MIFWVVCADCMHAIVVIGDGCGAMVGDCCEKCLLLRIGACVMIVLVDQAGIACTDWINLGFHLCCL